MLEAEKLFTKTFTTCNSRFAVISSFREISRLGFPTATLHIYDQYLQEEIKGQHGVVLHNTTTLLKNLNLPSIY